MAKRRKKKVVSKERTRAAAVSASGVGTASGVGASIAEATGNAAGVGAATAVGATPSNTVALSGTIRAMTRGGGNLTTTDEAAAQMIADSARKPNAAVLSTAGEVKPPIELAAAQPASGLTVGSPDIGSPTLTSPNEFFTPTVRREPVDVTESVEAVDTTDATIERARIKLIVSNLSEQPSDMRDAARMLSQAFVQQVETLNRKKPNRGIKLAEHNDLVAFFESMASGLNALADALDRAVNSAAGGLPEPALLGTAGEIAAQLRLGLMEWLENNRTKIFDYSFNIAMFGLGITFLHSIGLQGSEVMSFVSGVILGRKSKKKT